MGKIARLLLTLGWIVAIGAPARAVEDLRMERRLGIYATFLGDPIGLFGVNFAYQLDDFLRWEAGISSPLALSALGTGFTLFLPNHDFSPTLGVHYSWVFSYADQDVNKGPHLFYASVGFDWQSTQGVSIGAGLDTIWALKNPGNDSFVPLPYVNVGYHF
jgi:hypothetical protein